MRAGEDTQSCRAALDGLFPYASFRCSVRKPMISHTKPQSPSKHLSNEADIWILLFKYDFNFNYAVGSVFGERKEVLFVGNLKTTIASYLFIFLLTTYYAHLKQRGDLWWSNSLYTWGS